MRPSLSILEQKAISSFKADLGKAFGPRILGLKLFGSRARGKGHEWSDLDIFVLIDRVSPRERDDIFGMAAEVYGSTDIDISPLVMTEEEFHLWLDRERGLALTIDKEGVPL